MIYFNTASCGLLSEESIAQSNKLYHEMLTESSTAAEALRETGFPRIREGVARFMGAPVANLAFVPNFSYALNSLVQSLKGTEKVLLYKHDFPSVLEPFRINNFDITWIDSPDGFTIDTAELKRLLFANKIDLLVISHVQWLSGYTLDLEAIGSFCREHGITFIVDATQSLGALSIDVSRLPVDVLISSNYKWMNAGFGTGVMYASDEFLEKYPPVIGGYGSYVMTDGGMKLLPGIRCYEPGHTNFHGLLVLEAAVNKKLEMGIDAIQGHNRRLTKQLLDGLANTPILGPATLDNRCSIVMLKDESGNLHKHLLANNILAIRRDGYIRISFHMHNTQEEVALLIQHLKAHKG